MFLYLLVYLASVIACTLCYYSFKAYYVDIEIKIPILGVVLTFFLPMLLFPILVYHFHKEIAGTMLGKTWKDALDETR